MKKTILFIMVAIFVFVITACGIAPVEKTSSSLNDIQDIVRQTQVAFENKNHQETQAGISRLLELSQDSLYSENERLIARYCATYINAGVMLDYIIKNDNQWINTHNIDDFNILHTGIFVEVINGEVSHTETLKEYYAGLVQSTQEIYTRYNELNGK